MEHEPLNTWVPGFRFFCSTPHGFFRERINTRGVLLHQKTCCSAMTFLYHYVWDRDLSLTGCSQETKKSASLSDSTAQSRCVRRGQQWPSQLSELMWLLCCLHLCKGDAQLCCSWMASLATAVLFCPCIYVSLPPSLRSDVMFKNHFKKLKWGRGSLMVKQLRSCGEVAWNDWLW